MVSKKTRERVSTKVKDVKVAKHGIRRQSRADVELLMECMDDELSPAQLKAIDLAHEEHEKANNLIKAARAGNTLVPSSQPNTFTIVPHKPVQAPPPKQLATPPQQQTIPTSLLTPPSKAAQMQETPTRGLPPPRPVQFMNKHQAKQSPEVILIPDNEAPVPVSHPQQQVPPLTLMSSPPGVTPQQVYKFVSLPGNQPATTIGPNQWVIRPLQTVPPQQQGMMSQLSPTGQQMMAFNMMARTPNNQPVARQPHPVSGSEITKTSPAAYKTNMEKKTAAKRDEQTSGNWQPLDEYYYGTVEGDSKYTEEKGEFMFKCWYCSKMLYNNVRAMQHIQGHIDSSKQQNIDLSDLTQCKHCYKQFDTPFDMQTHVEKIHLSNKVLMCRICEKDMASTRDLTNHMKQNHKACEMPYVCQLCNFRSSMYSDVVDHFKKKHDSSNSLLCLYCLRTFSVKFVSQGWGQTQTYYGHLLKHQSKSTAKKCVVCRLTFFNANDVKTHRKTHHVSTNRGGGGAVCNSPIFRDIGERKGGHLKSLNAPSISKIQDYGGVKLPAKTSTSFCFECKMTMSSTDHYKKYINCSLCRFATMCSVAYANHMMGFHSGQMTSLNLNIPWERPMDTMMYCSCGFSTKYGNKIATHLVFCVKQTCYTKESKVNVTGGGAIKTGTSDDDGSLLGMLGLVQKKAKPTPDVVEPEASTSDDRPRKRPGPKSKRGRPRSTTPEAKDKADTKPIIKVSVTKVVLTDIKITKDQSTISESEPVKSAVVGEPVKNDDDDSKIEDQSMEVDTKEMETTDHKLDEKVTEVEENDTEKMAESVTNVNTETKGATEGEIAIKDGEVTQSESEPKSQVAEDQQMEDEILEENNTETDTVDKETEEMLLSDANATDKISEENAMEAEQIDKTEENEVGESMEEDVSEKVPVVSEKLPVEDKDDETMETETAAVEDLDTMETEPSVSGEKDEGQSSNSDVVDQAKEVEGKPAKDLEILTEEADAEIEDKTVVEDLEQADNVSQDKADNIQEDVEERTDDSKQEVAVENVAEESDKVIPQEAETEDTIDEEKTEQLKTEETKEEEQKSEEEQIEEEKEPEPKGEEETDKKDKIEEEKSETSEKEATEEKTADDGEKSEKKDDVKKDDRKKDETPDRGSRDERRHDDHTDKHRSDHYRQGDTHSSSSSHRDDRSRDYDRHRHDDRSHDDRYRRDDRSHGSYRSDSHHSNKPYDRNRDNRDRYDRDRGDNRSGYSSHGGHQDYRGQGQSGHHGGQQGQYGGNRGNRGGYNNNRDQERGNRGNRGGYNQGYRGGYQGGGGYY